jgi:hypothetical protein
MKEDAHSAQSGTLRKAKRRKTCEGRWMAEGGQRNGIWAR